MSLLSQEAIDRMDASSAEISHLEQRAEDIARQLQHRQITAGQARTALAQVESAAHKVETEKVDAVYTSELNSGKAMVKSEKKEQLARLERFFERLDVIFQWIKRCEATEA